MAANDHAILVGISRYRDARTFPTLQGPLNDVVNVRAWLTSTAGGDVPEANVHPLTTSAELLALPEIGWPPDTEWTPNRNRFSALFNQITVDQDTGDFLRRDGRLYLYFSGHGFSLLSDSVPRAALYGADNHGQWQSNLAGTLYAEAARRARLFREVVLIMDCCRDTELDSVYSSPDLGTYEHDNAEAVRVFAMYAAPKRGKAQERSLDEAEGKSVSLMTHAWLRALREAPCDVVGRVPGKVLVQYIETCWNAWYPERPPPQPRFVAPDRGDVFFRSGKPRVRQPFHLPDGASAEGKLRLSSDSLSALGMVQPGRHVDWRDTGYSWAVRLPVSPLPTGGHTFVLELAAEEHQVVRAMKVQTFMPSDQHAIVL